MTTQIPAKTLKKNKSPMESSSSQTSIDDLPKEILIKILSFLPIITAAQCSTVAPPWRNLWHKFPVMNFVIPESHGGPRRSIRYTRNLIGKMLTNSVLKIPSKIPVQKFKVSFTRRNYEIEWMFLDIWIDTVIRSNVVELDLRFDEIGVKVLRLSCCDLCKPDNMNSDKINYTLREIHLTEVYTETNEEIQHFVNSCVNLEVLTLDLVGFRKDCKIASNSLKVFRVTHSGDYYDRYWEYSVEIWAPKLESLGLCYAHDGKYMLKDLSSLAEADVVFPHRGWNDFAGWTRIVSSLGGVERLRIQNMWLQSMFAECEKMMQLGQIYEEFQTAKEVFSENFVFSNLKHVELLTGFSEDDILGLEILLNRCPQLESMVLVNNYNISDDSRGVELGPISLEIPRLKLVQMKKFQNTESELFVAGLLKKHGTVLDKVVAYPKRVEGESGLSFIL